MSAWHSTLLEQVRTHTACVGVVGLGYVGLPLARAFASRGFPVLGFDIDGKRLAVLHEETTFEATGDLTRLAACDALLLCVPTPLTSTREPDLSHVVAATRSTRDSLRPGQLVVLTSTTYPGTTRDVMLPLLAASGLAVGRDFFLAYSPEREDPGNSAYTTATIPRVVGGYDAASLELAAVLLGEVVVRVVPTSSLEVAEASKILENTYRAVNIALVNELKVLYDRMGIDIWEVIAAARTKPFGFQAFYPGPGLGGHCIPIDPFYLAWAARQHGQAARLIEVAGEINTAMPRHVVTQLAAALQRRGKPLSGSRVLLLGMAYKKDVDDVRESPGLELLALLRQHGAIVTYNDPHVPRVVQTLPVAEEQISRPLTEELLTAQDAVLIVTDHSVYDWLWIVAHSAFVVDTRNATRNVAAYRDRIVKA